MQPDAHALAVAVGAKQMRHQIIVHAAVIASKLRGHFLQFQPLHESALKIFLEKQSA